MTSPRKLEKALMRQRGRELRALLNEWNPIGVMRADAPPGDTEYDDLLWPILRLLEEGCSTAELVTFLARKLDEDYGLAPDRNELARVAERVTDWHAQS